ncbi:SMC family ATPase [Candidatus Woesearchaeota archaeon]|nr:SMC family ATPase [Candidatus Woesearchaeota archaeon]
MLVKSLKLKNIRSYKSLQISLDKGITLLSGDIGTGKSTILLSIEFALFGLKRGEISGGMILRHGENEGSVDLQFSVGNKDVIIIRALKNKNGRINQEAGMIIIDGVKEELTASELKTRVYELLGYPSEILSKSKDLIFRYTVYTPQETMKQILLDDDETRLDIIRRIFNIDKYKRIKDNVDVLSKSFRDNIRFLEGKTDSQARIENSLKEITKKLVEKSPEKDILEKQHNELKETIEQYELKYKEYRDVQDQYNKINSQKENLLSEIKHAAEQRHKILSRVNETEKELESLQNDCDKAEKKISLSEISGKGADDIKERLDKAYQKITEQTNLRKNLADQIKSAKDNIIELKSEIGLKGDQIEQTENKLNILKSKAQHMLRSSDDIKAQISELTQEEQKIISEIGSIQAQLDSSLKTIKQVSELDYCPMCRQTVTSEHKHKIDSDEKDKISESQLKKTQLSKKRDEIITEITKAQKELDATLQYASVKEQEKLVNQHILSQKDELKILIQKRDKTEQNLKELEKALSSMPDIKKSEQEYTVLKDTYEKISEIKTLKSRVELQKAAIDDKKKLIDTYKIDAGDYKEKVAQANKQVIEMDSSLIKMKEEINKSNQIEEELKKVKNKEREVDLKRERLESDQRAIMDHMESLKKEAEDLKKQRLEIKKLINTKNWVEDTFKNLITNIEQHVMMSIYSEFNDYFVRWFELLLEDDIVQVRLDDKFNPVIMQNGYETGFENLSGGEKTALSLAYRLSLNKVINNFVGQINTKDIIILDEPTDGFSSEQLDKIREVLVLLGLKQIIIVSHEQKIEGYVDYVISISKQNHISSADAY